MHIDIYVILAGLIVGFVVGMTGMGGGALMTPILVLFFRVQPLAAVSSDLVASLIMKPFGGAVHVRRHTVNWALAGWLMLGSVPCAFAGVLILRLAGRGQTVQDVVQLGLGIALLLAVLAIILKLLLTVGRPLGTTRSSRIKLRPLPTIAIGAIGGFIVGMTSVGSGSLIIVLLLFLYPALRAQSLVGTDLVQAVPLVGSAALGHVLFGDLHMSITISIIIGSIPGVLLGATVSSRAPGSVTRPALAFVLLATGLKLVHASNLVLGLSLGAALVIGAAVLVLFRASRVRHAGRAEHVESRLAPVGLDTSSQTR